MPDAVTKIKAIPQNSSCIILTWRMSANFRDKIFLQQMRRGEAGAEYGDIVTPPKKKIIGYNTFHESRDIPDSSVHGVLTHYRIWYNNQSIIKNVTSEDTHVTSVDLTFPSKDEHYWVKIAGATAVGESPQAASIFVPALDRKLTAPQDFLVEWSKDDQGSLQFFLSWADWSGHGLDMRRSVASDDHDALYIVWCPGSTTYMQCTGKLEWVRLPPETVTYKLDPGSLERDPNDFLIGIAAKNGFGYSSGIHWSSCVYEYNIKPQTAPLNVRVSQVSPAEDSLVVTWQKPGCHKERSHITEYLIKYCLFNGYKCIGENFCLVEHCA
ncbi:cytokine receptor-like isoform x2 [Plakobranchus ocellatus]|uniref:Cytokine receptor-like isoform x2 n=1 Tax=Plakobranchus ocellatus TaxID=259542 RepID=A0AAV4ARA6_9GAST|nr:cytokine receptor-like isoform x2 [Plakobranchus ocellatus]